MACPTDYKQSPARKGAGSWGAQGGLRGRVSEVSEVRLLWVTFRERLTTIRPFTFFFLR